MINNTIKFGELEYLPTKHFGWVRMTPKETEKKNPEKMLKFYLKMDRLKRAIEKLK